MFLRVVVFLHVPENDSRQPSNIRWDALQIQLI